MNVTNFLLLPPQKLPVQTTWEDVVRSDHTRDSMTVIQTIVQFMRCNPSETFRSVEIRLRKEHRFTHLIAEEKDKNLPANVRVLDVNHNECMYQLFITTRNPDIVLAEKRARVPNHQLNLERLERTGVKSAVSVDYLRYFAKVGGHLEVNKGFIEDLEEHSKN